MRKNIVLFCSLFLSLFVVSSCDDDDDIEVAVENIEGFWRFEESYSVTKENGEIVNGSSEDCWYYGGLGLFADGSVEYCYSQTSSGDTWNLNGNVLNITTKYYDYRKDEYREKIVKYNILSCTESELKLENYSSVRDNHGNITEYTTTYSFRRITEQEWQTIKY